MARDVVDIALVEINAPSVGSKELSTVVSFNVSKTDPKTAVKTMNRRRRAIGFTRGVPDFSVDMEVILLAGEPEVDWDDLQQKGEVFSMTYERGEDGQRRTLVDCTVGDISEPYSEGGETKQSVKLLALDERAE